MSEVLPDVLAPIDGHPEGKNVLSMTQFSERDIFDYINEAAAADYVTGPNQPGGADLLRFKVLKAVMRQPSTRTGGSMTTAMFKLGGAAELISGMEASAESKGESRPDSWVAFATQADVIGTRTYEDCGPHEAAAAIQQSYSEGNLSRIVPVINLGDGKNEHPTQALGDLYTIHKKFNQFSGLKLAVVGDHERYRAFHSLLIGAFTVGMNVIAVEIPRAPVPDYLVQMLGDKLTRTDDLDGAMREADVLYMGREPDEYDRDNGSEATRSTIMKKAYYGWWTGIDRLQQMSPNAIVLHPRPRRRELDVSADIDPRTKDVQQMENMLPMRMAILAKAFGRSIKEVA